MNTVSYTNKIEFYKFLNGEKSIEDLENFIYSQLDLEQQLGNETYLNLIELNFKDKYDKVKLSDLITNKIIEEGQFETWKLRRILNDFLNEPEKTDINLDKIYHLYCGVYQENGQRKYEFKFLGNLGLNYLYWTDKSYLKTNYGENWKAEYEKCSYKFEFYHEQLKDFAKEILLAIEYKQIEVLNDGTYVISKDLKSKLETEQIYKLKHPDEKYGR
jgi:hypothetical protein